jgi:hypothetical protein
MNQKFIRKLFSVVQAPSLALRAMPLSASLLLLLLLMPSSMIFGEREWDGGVNWIKGSFLWFDLLIGIALFVDLICKRVVLSRLERIAFVVILVIYLWSWWMGVDQMNASIFLTIFSHWLRLLFGYVVMKSIAAKSDLRSSLAYLNTIGIGLCFSSIFVAILAYERMPRLYGAGMTVASFGQVLAALIFINVCFKNWRLVIFFAMFLIPSLSRTSIITLLILLLIRRFASGKLPKTRELIKLIIIIGFLAFGLAFLYEKSYLFAMGVDNALKSHSVETLGSRTLIWEYAMRLGSGGYVPWHGVGIFGTEKLLWNVRTIFEGVEDVATHFHSIIIEAIFGAGWLGWILLMLPLIGFHSVWKSRSAVGMGVYALFLVTQSIDFTLFRPKEELMWGMLLGFSAVIIFNDGCIARKVHACNLRRIRV